MAWTFDVPEEPSVDVIVRCLRIGEFGAEFPKYMLKEGTGLLGDNWAIKTMNAWEEV